MDGWKLEEFDELTEVFDDIITAKYEIDNCIRGCHTDCTTYAELASHLSGLGERLSACANYLKYKKEEDCDEDD